ncbi:MAG: acyltransferase domain-containing protein [Acidimicrobiia bacterium]
MASAASVRDRFRINESNAALLDELEAIDPIEPVLPERNTARELLGRLAVPPGAVDDIVDRLPAIHDDSDARWLVARCYTQLVRRIGAREPGRLRWPSLADADEPLAPYLYVAIFLAAVPDIERWYVDHEIASAILWATLADVGGRMAIRARVSGRRGLDTEQHWLTQHFTGQLFQLGRLQFNRSSVWYEAGTLEELEAGFAHGDPALGVHIRRAGPLDPTECDASFALAREFFDRYFPDHHYRVAVCTSWLLDDQLADYLPADSNIVRFQRRFRMIPGASPGNDDVFEFVFDGKKPDLDLPPQGTRLERAIVRHLRDGGAWRVRTGWVEL